MIERQRDALLLKRVAASNLPITWQQEKETWQTRVLSYCANVALLLVDASVHDYHLVTNSAKELKALNEMQNLMMNYYPNTLNPSTLEIIRLTLPNLTAKSAEDIDEIRYRLRDFLLPFRTEIAKLATGLPRDIPAKDIRFEAQRIVDKEIKPNLVSLERYLKNPSHVFLKNVISASEAFATVPITFVGSMLVGVPLEYSILLSPLIHILSSMLKTVHGISEEKWKNPFTFALLAENEARR